jgi:hypothetical protein
MGPEGNEATVVLTVVWGSRIGVGHSALGERTLRRLSSIAVFDLSA